MQLCTVYETLKYETITSAWSNLTSNAKGIEIYFPDWIPLFFFPQHSVSWINLPQHKNINLKFKLNVWKFFSLKPVTFFTLTCTFLWAFREKARNRLPTFSFNLLMVSFLLFIPVPALFFPLYYWAAHNLWGRVMSVFNLLFILLNKPVSFSYDRFTLSLLILNHKLLYFVYLKNIF